MDLVQQLAPYVQDYGYLVVFFGSAVSGESVVLAALFLSFFGYLDFYKILAVSFCGVFIADTLWYVIGYYLHPFVTGRRWNFLPNQLNGRIDKIKSRLRRDQGKIIFFSKFAYGTRIMVLLSAGYERLPYKTFFCYNLLGNLLLFLMIAGAGYGMGISQAYWRHLPYYWLYLALGVFFLLYLLRWAFNKLIAYRYEQ